MEMANSNYAPSLLRAGSLGAAGAVLEGEIGAEPSLRRPAGALERICMCAASCAVKSCSSFLVMEILKSRTACCKSAWLRSPGQVWKEYVLIRCFSSRAWLGLGLERICVLYHSRSSCCFSA